jgi:hypothetical protein
MVLLAQEGGAQATRPGYERRFTATCGILEGHTANFVSDAGKEGEARCESTGFEPELLLHEVRNEMGGWGGCTLRAIGCL